MATLQTLNLLKNKNDDKLNYDYIYIDTILAFILDDQSKEKLKKQLKKNKQKNYGDDLNYINMILKKITNPEDDDDADDKKIQLRSKL
jgi:hypothetical protein